MAKIYRFFRIVMSLIDFSCFLTRVASDTTLDLQLPCVHSSDFLVSMLKHFYQLGTRIWWIREFPFLWRTETRKRRRDHHKPFLSLPWENWNYFHKKSEREGQHNTVKMKKRGSNWLYYNSEDTDWKIRKIMENVAKKWQKSTNWIWILKPKMKLPSNMDVCRFAW